MCFSSHVPGLSYNLSVVIVSVYMFAGKKQVSEMRATALRSCLLRPRALGGSLHYSYSFWPDVLTQKRTAAWYVC